MKTKLNLTPSEPKVIDKYFKRIFQGEHLHNNPTITDVEMINNPTITDVEMINNPTITDVEMINNPTITDVD